MKKGDDLIKQPRVLGTLRLAMITVAAIISLRNLPLSATFGLSSIFYFGVAALIYFIPIALVAAELASTWPKPGGSYVWVGENFGKSVGFLALWSNWSLIVAWFPAILAFTATMLGHFIEPFFPGMAENKIFYFAVMLVVFWGATFINFLGMNASGWISTLGVVCGTIIPGFLIIGLGIGWVLMGHPAQVNFSWSDMLPEFRLDTMVFFAGILLSLGGVEVAAFHIREAKDPRKSYPRAVGLAAILILIISILGTLSIAIVVPKQDISLLSGLIQAFTELLSPFGLSWAVPALACMALIGALAGINTWTVGPAKGLLVTAEDGFLPRYLRVVNQKGVPIGMLIFQAAIGTALSLVFLWMDSHSAAFWVLTAISAQFTLIQYALVFAAGLRSRYKHPDIHRPFQIPGGKVVMWIISVMGIAVCCFGFGIVYIPPAQLDTGDAFQYQLLLTFCLCVLVILPIYLALLRQRRLAGAKADAKRIGNSNSRN